MIFSLTPERSPAVSLHKRNGGARDIFCSHRKPSSSVTGRTAALLAYAIEPVSSSLQVEHLEEAGADFETSAAKSWVTAANHADSYVSSGQKPGASSPLESTIYLVRAKSPGVRVTSAFDGLGLRGNDSAPVSLDHLKVQQGDLISK